MDKLYIKIEGIHCAHCVDLISNNLLKIQGVDKVSIQKDIACIYYKKEDGHEIDVETLVETINKLGYITKAEYISENLKALKSRIRLSEFIVILLVILLIVTGLNRIFGFNVFNMIPTIDDSVTYGMLVVTGFFTSIHCISMCGAINLSAAGKSGGLSRPLLYNLGRVISYTVIGMIAGFLGKVISFSSYLSGAIIILAAIVMLLMSLGMLGIIDFRVKFFKHYCMRSRNSFLIGLLNGLMPCGPLQAMQLYALSTGSALKGALSMFLFAVGTVPLMFAVGAMTSLVNGKAKIWINKVAATLILILSAVMLNRGLRYCNIDITAVFDKSTDEYDDRDNYIAAVIADGYQVVEFSLEYDSYADVIVQKDIPVKMIINAEEQKITGCNNELISSGLGFSCKLQKGENVIEFTPTETGIYMYTCWMNMIKNNIKVIDDEEWFEK